ncbi:bifunctional folylpolyglutamate synthase/dihydrofolate synthase [Propionicimonas sp.]|uniref:bifunctional folylpolyglutamate synthase/dihydrofolate synthase n=1 Tax=Propionicimonas sp. TaxID=1955623 RepID=UPI003D12E0ED
MSRTHAQIVAELQARWPEHRVAPSQARVQALCDLLGSPEQSCPVILIAGTNGKGSTALMIDSLLRSLGLRVGRYASPHLVDLTERISIDGEPIPADRFDELVEQVAPLVELVDDQLIDGVRMTFFEVMTALAYAAFADAPVDVAVVEVGLGGRWDATNIVAADVAVVCPIDLDHTHLLGNTVAEIAAEKAGIIKAGSKAVLAAQQPDAARVLLARCAEVGAEVIREGMEFGLIDRTPAVGGQILRLETAEGPLGDLALPLFGAHMAHNAALAVAAAEAFLGGKPLPAEVIAEGLEQVKAPGRLEVVRRSPTVVLDTCHNPHGARATIDGITEAFDFTPLIGVVAMMADKDVAGVLSIFAEAMTTVVCTTIGSTSRALPASGLAERAAEVFGADRVVVAASMAEAIDEAVRLADEAGPGAGVLVAGSVYAAGEARALLVRDAEES